MARVYADECIPFPVVEELRRLGHDVLTSRDAGQANLRIPDDQVLAFAGSTGRIVLTLNRRDFRRLHRQSDDHAGIVICTQDLDFVALAKRIDERLRSAADLKRQLISVLKM